MLELHIDPECGEYFDEATGEFVYPQPHTHIFEHSLASISKWEAIWKKPFLTDKEKTKEEADSYLRCMLVGGDPPDKDFPAGMSNSDISKINEYMNDSQTATWFSERENKKHSKSKRKGETITAELVYYWMISFDIPFECQHWHINRLLTLIRVCSVKESGGDKMSKKDILKSNAQLNAARRAKHGTRG